MLSILRLSLVELLNIFLFFYYECLFPLALLEISFFSCEEKNDVLGFALNETGISYRTLGGVNLAKHQLLSFEIN